MIDTVPLVVVAAVSVTIAVAEPLAPVAVTDTVLDAGIVEGAVYSPEELTVPAVADQLATLDEVNCCVPPRTTVAVVGEMVCAVAATRVTVALTELTGPVAVMVTLLEDGIVDGAV